MKRKLTGFLLACFVSPILMPANASDAKIAAAAPDCHPGRLRTLLDHSLILYGSSMSNGSQHDHDPSPVVVAGGASGRLKGDRHIVPPPHTPMSNLLLAILDKLGVEQDSFGDSTGKVEI